MLLVAISCTCNDFKVTHLIFHDSSLIYSYDYLVWLKHNLSADLLSTEFSFIDGFDFPSKLDGVLEKGVVFNDFADLYVCAYPSLA